MFRLRFALSGTRRNTPPVMPFRRDSDAFKSGYAYRLRRRGSVILDLTDFGPNTGGSSGFGNTVPHPQSLHPPGMGHPISSARCTATSRERAYHTASQRQRA